MPHIVPKKKKTRKRILNKDFLQNENRMPHAPLFRIRKIKGAQNMREIFTTRLFLPKKKYQVMIILGKITVMIHQAVCIN